MYLVGGPHPNRLRAGAALARVVGDGERLVTDVEVIQEILHRYVSISRRELIQPAIDALYGVVDAVLAVTEEPALAAKDLVLAYPRLSARDAIHAAVMRAHGVTRVLTFDQDFRDLPDLVLVDL